MATEGRWGWRGAGGLLGIFVIALETRLLYLWQARDVPSIRVPLSDGRLYYEWAGRIAAGEWWQVDTFYQAPLYPYLLALLRLPGGDPVPRILVVQAVLGALACVLTAMAASWIWDRRVGMVAGILQALYAPAVFLECLVQKTVLDSVLIAGMLACLAAAQRTPRNRTWLGAGLLLGLLTLSRQNALLLAVTLPVWILFQVRDRAPWRRVAWVGAFALGLAVALSPIAVRNYTAGGRVSVTTYQLGSNLYIGNNPLANGHYMPLRPGREDPAFESMDAIEIAQAARGRRLTPQEVSDYWVERSLDFVRTQPGKWLALTARKFLLLLNTTEIIDVQDFYTQTRHSSLLRVLGWFANFGVIFPLAAAGIWLTWRDRSKVWVVYVVLFTLFVATLPFFVFGRYRFPIVPPLLLLAAAAVVETVDRVRSRRLASLVGPAVVALAAGGITWLPLVSRLNQEAAASVNEGIAAAQIGRLDQALEYEDRAIQVLPGLIQAHYQRAVLLQTKGQPEAAQVEYERVLALDPTNETAMSQVGRLLNAQGRPVEGVARLEEFLRHNPDRVSVRRTLAMSLVRLGRLDEARRQCEKAIATDPGHGENHALLGQVLLASRDTVRAIESLRRAVEVSPNLAAAHVALAAALLNQGHGGRNAEAESHLRRAIALDPATPGGYELLVRTLVARGDGSSVPAILETTRRAGHASANLYFSAGRDLQNAGDVAGALAVLEAGAAQFPDSPDVLNALAWYLVTMPGDGSRSAERALGLARKAVRLTKGNWPYALDTEAAALAASGQYAKAAEVASSAASLARQQDNPALGAEIEKRARLYRSGKPFVER